MTVLMATGEVVAFQAQYKLTYLRNGKRREHIVDLCVDFRNGCRILYVVRNSANTKDLEFIVEQIRNQDLKKHAHEIRIVTEETIPKEMVHKAEEILRAKTLANRENNDRVLHILADMGRRATIYKVLERLPACISWAEGWTAIWSLIADGLVRHDHPRAAVSVMTDLSTIQLI